MRLNFFILVFFPLSLLALGELKVGVSNQPESLFYPIANDHVSDLVSQLVVEPLVRVDSKTNKITAGLAHKWSVKKTQIIFEIDPLARFSDSTKVTAQDVQNTFEAFSQKQIPSPDFFSQFSAIKAVRVLKANKVLFRFNNASPDHLQRISWLYILPKTALQNFEQYKNFANNLFGSGPYLLESVLTGNKIMLGKNPHYWNRTKASLQHKYLLDKIEVKIIPDYNTQIEMLKNGAIDYLHVLSSKAWNVDLTGSLIDTGKIIKSQNISKLPYQTSGIVWNTRLPLFQSQKTRTALAHLFPVEKFIRNFFYDSYVPASGIFHPQSDCHARENTPKVFNPLFAQKLLDEEGWKKNEQGLLNKNGISFKFNLIVRQPASIRHLTLYQEELKKIGIQMSLVSMDWVLALNKVRSRDFEASEYSMDRPLLLSELSSQWGTNGGLNYSGISDKKLDLLLKMISQEFSSEKRILLCKELDRRVSELQPLSFGWEQVYLRLAYSNKYEVPSPALYAYSTWTNTFHHWDGKNSSP